MSYVMQTNLRMRWIDKRLIYNHPSSISHKHNSMSERLPVDDQTFKKLWLPEIFFPNENKARIHTITTVNKRAWIYSDGMVEYEIRTSLTLQSPILQCWDRWESLKIQYLSHYWAFGCLPSETPPKTPPKTPTKSCLTFLGVFALIGHF